MKRARVLAVVFGVVLIGVLGMQGLADFQDSLTVNVTILSSLDINIAENTFSFGDIEGSTVGVQTPNSFINAQMRCNQGSWQVTAAGQDFSNATSNIIEISKLGFSVVADNAGGPGADYTYISSAGTTIYSSADRTKGWENHDIYPALNLAGDEAAGSYSTTVTFTIATP